MSKKTQGKSVLSLYTTFVLYALVPTFIAVGVICSVLISTVKKEVRDLSRDYMVSLVSEAGINFDYYISNGERVVLDFTHAPIVKKFLLNPDDEALAKEAQAYTNEYFSKLDDWEGIYIANWDTILLTHNNEEFVGRTMREGERRTELQEAMLNDDDNIFNVGIINSPVTDALIVSMYAPVYDDDGTPIGYIGAGAYAKNIVEKFENVKELGYNSAYAYVLKADGTMVYHPDESKIGNMVENEGVLGLVNDIKNGIHPDPVCLEYEYKGTAKYGACYVSDDDSYISVITADQSDILSNLRRIEAVAVAISVILFIAFTFISLYIAGKMSRPLKTIAETNEKLATGNISGASFETKSKIKEIGSLIVTTEKLRASLDETITNVKEDANVLTESITNVNEKVQNNTDNVGQINLAMSEVAQTSQYVAKSSTDLTERVIDLGNHISELDENVKVLQEESKTIEDANKAAIDCMNSVIESSSQSVKTVDSIAQGIIDTNEAVKEIQQCVVIINGVLSQTKLLALNASIEAARAGEAGKGFAVVAENIQKLAESSTDNVSQITDIIANVTSLSEESVKVAEGVKALIDEEQNNVTDARAQFEALSESVKSSVKEINSISEKTRKLETIRAEFNTATNDLCSIAEELGATAEEVSASCSNVVDACKDTLEHTEEMTAINSNLMETVAFLSLIHI